MTALSSLDAQGVPLLATKLYIPASHPNLVSRPRLIQRLDEGLRPGCRLLLVSAPAGFGKTMLVAEWVQRRRADAKTGPAGDGVQPADSLRAVRSARAVEAPAFAWLSLDGEDNDPARFFTYLIGALETVNVNVTASARTLSQSPQSPSHSSALTALVNSLASHPADLLLVLDDYHVIEQQSIHHALLFLVDHLPPQVHLVVVSRADPPWPLARLRTRSQLAELRAADLRFTPDEAAAFLNDAMRLDLSTEDVAALEALTEGWIAGLQLAALSMRGKAAEHVADFIAVFSGSNRHVIDYLAEEVLAQQPEEIHDFLCQTAILDRLTAPLCDAVTGRGDSDVILKQLEQDNLFLVPLDDQRKWYRYHRLFADFLQNHLQHDMPDRVVDLHCWAAEWYERNGMADQAVIHLLDAGDFEWAARLIQKLAPMALMRGQVTRVLAWLEALPAGLVRSRPQLGIFRAEALTIAGQLDAIETILQDVERGMQSSPPTTDDRDLLGQIAAIRAYQAVLQADLPRANELARQAFEYLPESNVLVRTMVLWLLGLTRYFDEGVVAATRALSETLELSQAAGSTFMTMLSTFTFGYLHVMQGHLRQAKDIFLRGLQLAGVDERRPDVSEGEHPPLGVSLVYQGLGEVFREQNDLENADRYLTDSVALGEQWGNAEMLSDSYVFAARTKRGLGDIGAAHALFRKAERLALDNQVSPLTTRQVDAHHARLWVAEGNLETAARWAASLGQVQEVEGGDSGQIALYVRVVERSTLVRLLIARHEFDEAMDVLALLLQGVEAAGWTGVVIELLALQALVLHGQGRTTEALAVCRRTLSLAEPEGYVRVFVDEGAQMAKLLRMAASKGIAVGYVRELLAAFVQERSRSQVSGSRPTSAPVSSLRPETLKPETLLEPLSEREIQVLRLIADGLSNREIADRLTIAVGTAKRHASNIYAKLDVHSRVQAVARAQELRLL
jgi:LuxR family maltose regulon positive regulatory protein